MDDKPRPFKLMLRPDTANALDHVAADLKSAEGNYQIGVGTIAARLLETLAAHPDLIQELLAEYARNLGNPARAFHEDESALGIGARAHPKARKRASGE